MNQAIMPSVQALSAVEAWRLLRTPFMLPCESTNVHCCRWEFIAMDCCGCVLCGAIHLCSLEACESVVVTKEAVVCTITGVCVNTNPFAESEYSENVIVYTSVQDKQDILEARMAVIDSFVREFLLSSSARKSAEYEHLRKLAKYHTNVSRLLRSSQPVDLVVLIQASLSLYTRKVFDTSLRESVRAKCSAVVKQVLCLSHAHHGLVVKDAELRNFVFGLLYLMQRGVKATNTWLLPCVPQLGALLPSETNVGRFLNFRSKHITETENKFKFLFRHVNPKHLAAMRIHVQ